MYLTTYIPFYLPPTTYRLCSVDFSKSFVVSFISDQLTMRRVTNVTIEITPGEKKEESKNSRNFFLVVLNKVCI